MLDSTRFRDLVSGRRRGVWPSAVRGLLRLAEVPYASAVRWRNARYDRDRAVAHRVGVPVVSVGNLTLGGTGKTPLVRWIARWFIERGTRVAIVSRGYGAMAGQPNDEARELEQALPEVPHVQDPDRVAGARRAIDEFRCELILLDDGFQHRRLARDLDIVLLDALEPFGWEHVFPRGTLREPVTGLRRANVVCLSRADLLADADRDGVRRRVTQIAPHAAWCEVAHVPSCLRSAAGHARPFEVLRGRRVAAFCGIGNPAGFRHTLTGTGCDLIAWREFPDHYTYTPTDVHQLGEMAAACGAEYVVCTHKDLVKLPQEHLGRWPLWAVIVEMEVHLGREVLERELSRASQRDPC